MLKLNLYKRTQLINLDWSTPRWDSKLLDIEKRIFIRQFLHTLCKHMKGSLFNIIYSDNAS